MLYNYVNDDDIFYSYEGKEVNNEKLTEINEKIESMKEWMTGLIQQLYGYEKFDKVSIESYLEEICYQLGMSIPKDELKITSTAKHPAPLSDHILDKWKALNNSYLLSLKN